MSIQGVGAGTKRDFTQDELDAMHANSDTSKVLNRARTKAGQNGDDVTVRGDDGTLHDKLEDNKTHVSKGKAVIAAADAIHVAEGVGLAHVGGHGMKAGITGGVVFAAVAIPLATFFATQVALKEMQDTKDGTRDAATRDVLHAGMLLSLELPKSFVDSEIKKLGVGTSNSEPAGQIKNQLVGTPLGATLQLHCDQGVHAAQDFLLVPGRTKEQFFASNPQIKQRYDADAAFRAGFDAYVAASNEDKQTMSTNINARDIRYQAGGIPVKA